MNLKAGHGNRVQGSAVQKFRYVGLSALGLALFLMTAPATSARAAFQGQNGLITFVKYPSLDENPSPPGPQIWEMNADGSNQVEVLGSTSSSQLGSPSFSPNGQEIVFINKAKSGHRSRIWKMNADGSDPIQLTQGSLGEAYPSFSPDGKQIVFQGGAAGAHSTGIFEMSADGSQIKRLTKPSTFRTNRDAWEPSFSPNGKKIVFLNPHVNNTNNAGIEVMNANGSQRTLLRQSNQIIPGHAYPSFSPNGKQILFDRSTSFNGNRVYVMNADGSHQKPLTPPGGNDEYPSFSPDGTKIAFQGRAGHGFGAVQIWEMNADGSQRTQITTDPSLGNTEPSWGSAAK